MKADYWREKYMTEMIEMEEEDHKDLNIIFNKFCSQSDNKIPQDMTLLWEQQGNFLKSKSAKGYRWHQKIIRLCLDLYCKNLHVLEPLRSFIRLPSNRTIRSYKNKVDQRPGWNDDILPWCLMEAKKRKLKEQDYWGGFVIDEMKIQKFQEHTMTSRGGVKGSEFDGTISLLRHTSSLVELFNDKLPIHSLSDVRLKKLISFYSFFLSGEKNPQMITDILYLPNCGLTFNLCV